MANPTGLQLGMTYTGNAEQDAATYRTLLAQYQGRQQIDPSRLWSNTQALDPNAPPIFRQSDLQRVTQTAGGSIDNPGTEQTNWILQNQNSPVYRGSGGMSGAQGGGNYQISNDPSGAFTFTTKSGPSAGQQFSYQLVTGTDGQQYYVPQGQGTQVGMTTNHDWTAPVIAATMIGGGYFGGGAAFGGSGAGAAGASAADLAAADTAAGLIPAGTAGAATMAGAGTGISGTSLAGAGAAAGGAAAAGGGGAGTAGTTAASGSGLGGLLNNISPTQAVQLAGLLGGALGGKLGGSPSASSASNPYAGTNPMVPLSQLQPSIPRPVLPDTSQYDPNSQSAQQWKQYTGSLFGPAANPGAGVLGQPQIKPGGVPLTQPGLLNPPGWVRTPATGAVPVISSDPSSAFTGYKQPVQPNYLPDWLRTPSMSGTTPRY